MVSCDPGSKLHRPHTQSASSLAWGSPAPRTMSYLCTCNLPHVRCSVLSPSRLSKIGSHILPGANLSGSVFPPVSCPWASLGPHAYQAFGGVTPASTKCLLHVQSMEQHGGLDTPPVCPNQCGLGAQKHTCHLHCIPHKP